MEIKNNDFVKIEYELYANEKLAQTTNEKLAKENNLQLKNKGPQTIIVGKNFIVEALDKDIIKDKKKDNTLELTPIEAFGKRDKKLIKTFTKTAFDEQKLRAVPGMVYDFNGTFGTVKSVTGGRVMVDFNSPLAGKNIKLKYKIVEKVEKIEEKLDFVFENILKIPKNICKLAIEDKEIKLSIPKELIAIKTQLSKTIEEYIPEIKDYKFNFEESKISKN